jgi:hypothetical protein
LAASDTGVLKLKEHRLCVVHSTYEVNCEQPLLLHGFNE